MLAGTLALPAPAYAIDYALQLQPSKVPEAHVPAGWRLMATTITRGQFETFGVTLGRTFLGGRAEESHGLRAALSVGTVAFDGVRGRWDTQKQVGGVVSVRMSIRATGALEALEDAWGCRGSFARVSVVLRGTFVLRTGTRFFGTIRRSQLKGILTFRTGGAADCSPPSVATCTPWTDFHVTRGFDSVYASPDSRGRVALSFREGGRTGPVWYHVLTVTRLEPFAGALPALNLRIPAGLPITGAGTFTATESSDSTVGSCRVTTTRGAFTGTFRARFAGWGTRTLAMGTYDAAYREAR